MRLRARLILIVLAKILVPEASVKRVGHLINFINRLKV